MPPIALETPSQGKLLKFCKKLPEIKKKGRRQKKPQYYANKKKGTMTEKTKGNHFSKEEKKMWTFSLPKMTLEERKRF